MLRATILLTGLIALIAIQRASKNIADQIKDAFADSDSFTASLSDLLHSTPNNQGRQ